jgi:hypothetical protein
VLGKVGDMQITRNTEPAGSPVPSDETGDPAAEREARRTARDERRGASGQPRAVMIPRRDKRLPVEAPVMRVVATAGIVGISVVISAIMGSQDAQGWVIGLVVSLVSLALAAVLWSSRRL